MSKIPSPYRCLGGMLLVAGTAIGAGMLALPIATGLGGIGWSSTLFILGFLYMLATLFLLLEANLYTTTPHGNLISMAREHLGLLGQVVAWLAFLLLLYAVSSAYISGGASLIQTTWPGHFSHTTAPIAFALSFGALAFLGLNWMDHVNRVLMLGLLLTYVTLIALISPQIQTTHFSGGMPHYLFSAIPIVVLSFTSHIILPSLRERLYDHIPSLKKVLFFGSLIPIVCYLIWESLIIGLLPLTGQPGLLEIAQSSDGLSLLARTLSAQNIAYVGLLNNSFSFFAMITSFLGVIISLFDFLADGLKWRRRGKTRICLLLLTFAPPLTLALLFPSFVTALDYAGVMVAILYGILPVFIVWRARYHLRLPDPAYKLPGGKLALLLIFTLALCIIGLQISAANHWLPTP